MLASSSDLARLDAALAALRRLWEHPTVKRRFMELLGRRLEYSVLRTLRAIEHADGEPGVRHVAEALGVDGSTASRFVDQAVAAGCLTRETSPRDRRCCVLTLTEQGRLLLAETAAARTTVLAELTDGWTAQDVVCLSALLERLSRRVHQEQKAEEHDRDHEPERA